MEISYSSEKNLLPGSCHGTVIDIDMYKYLITNNALYFAWEILPLFFFLPGCQHNKKLENYLLIIYFGIRTLIKFWNWT